MLAIEMHERKFVIFHVRILVNYAMAATKNALYQCSYIYYRDGACLL